MESQRQPLLSPETVVDPYSQVVLVGLYPQQQQSVTAAAKPNTQVTRHTAHTADTSNLFCHTNSFRLLSMGTAAYAGVVYGLNLYPNLLQQNTYSLLNYVTPAFKLSFLLLAMSTIKPIKLNTERVNLAIFLTNALLAASVSLSISKIFQPGFYDWNAENATFAIGLAILPYGLIHDFSAIYHDSALVKGLKYLTAMGCLAAAGLAIYNAVLYLYDFWADVTLSGAISLYLLTMAVAGMQITNEQPKTFNVLQSLIYILATAGAITSVVDKFVPIQQVDSNLLLFGAMTMGALAEFCLGYALLDKQIVKPQPATASLMRSVNRDSGTSPLILVR